MRREQMVGLLALLVITGLAAVLTDRPHPQPEPETENDTYVQLLAVTPTAELTGERTSPDGRFQVRTRGRSDQYVSGLVVPERLEVVDASTGAVLWEDRGYLTQSALWSPDSGYLALAYGGRTWQRVKLLETDTWTSWDFTLPDGSPIPEYTFLPEDWGKWLPEDAWGPEALQLTVGDGESVEQHTYLCYPDGVERGTLTGYSLERFRETLPGPWDFDHDGAPEIVTLLANLPFAQSPTFYVLQVQTPSGDILWEDGAASAHAGWNSLFACTVDGGDYLLRYHPTMYQGACTYDFQVFSLDGDGSEQILDQDSVDFNTNIGAPHDDNSFDPAAIAAFMDHVNGYLEKSTLLLTTDEALDGIDPQHPRDQLWWLTERDEIFTYNDAATLEENLRAYQAARTEARS